MFVYRLRIALKLALLVLLPSTLMPRSGWAQQSPALLAQTPPMGWNSWDAYGLTITEAQFRANVRVLAPLRSSGWRYAVIDEGWYMQNPFASKAAEQQFHLDAHGRLIPAPQRFPSSINDAGLKPIADWVHAQGLLFGIHLIRGIPRESVRRNLPIAGSHFTAAEAGDPNDVCPWDDGNYGVRDNAAGQAWYDSMVALYASWRDTRRCGASQTITGISGRIHALRDSPSFRWVRARPLIVWQSGIAGPLLGTGLTRTCSRSAY